MAKRRCKKEWLEAKESYHKRILVRLEQDQDFNIHQYKSLYFSIFREAYESGFCAPLSYRLRPQRDGYRIEWINAKPLVTGDSIWFYAKEKGWVHSEMKGTEIRYQQINTVRTWWNEWTYAWHQLMYKTRCHQRIEDPT
jgi:hypothetical protein